MTGPAFTTIEVAAYRPGSVSSTGRYGWSAIGAWGSPMPDAAVLEDTTTVRASDVGYRTEQAAGDVINYPAVLLEAPDIDRHLELDPASSAAPMTVGRAVLVNDNGRFDQLATDYTSDSRRVTIKTGRRVYDSDRGYFVDPVSTALTTLFAGLAESWRLTEAELEIPLRDPTYALQRPYLRNTYAGTGGLNGAADMGGTTIPRTRGGITSLPVRGIQPLLIDPVARIYQYNDAPGTVVQVYEGGAAVFTSAGDVADLYTGTTPAGQFRTNNARGIFQLGSTAVGVITADVTGSFPIAGTVNRAALVAQYIMTEDLGIPSSMVNSAAFTALSDTYQYPGGWYWPSGDATTGAGAVGLFLRSLGAKLVPMRDGQLSCVLLRSIPSNIAPAATLSTAQIIRLAAQQLSAPLDPPAYRWRLGGRRNHTPMTSSLNAGLTDAQRRAVGQEWLVGTWSSNSILAVYANPSDPDLIPTALLSVTHARLIATAIGAQWGSRPRLYDIDLPEEIAMSLDLGSVVRVTYPAADLRAGKLGQVVGEQRRAGQTAVTLQVLV
ncbi:hypothetical protein BKE38_05060 [Pseudoroseomonas deserti]|uniref:Tip attachment protein J domain-containing protein n=1 Tax=Teichococcus deserti TaxID=1817963 RepID=A0A1V2H6E3_9PROT|nr:hypothetical protein [Pseudoroseomonas deserti]ONG56965.1 hypothetical protein BKE38_05060 [Pseudoroseomonas deserti]